MQSLASLRPSTLLGRGGSASDRARRLARDLPPASCPSSPSPAAAFRSRNISSPTPRRGRRRIGRIITRASDGNNNNNNNNSDDDDGDGDAQADAALAGVAPRDARLIGALLQVGITGSLAVLLGAATGTEPVARLWRGLFGADGGAVAAASAAEGGGGGGIAAAAAAALPYFLPLVAADALLFAVPWRMPVRLMTVSRGGRRCVDARAAGAGGGAPLLALVQAGLALHRGVALLPPRLATAAFADGPDDDDDADAQKDKGARGAGSGGPAPPPAAKTREARLAALGLAPPRPPPSASPPAAAAAAATGPPAAEAPTASLADPAAAAAAALPLPAEAALVAARELGKELLQRGAALVFAARWLTDRFLEAGADESDAFGLGLPAAAVAASAAASLLTAAIVPAAAAEAAGVRAAAAAALAASSKEAVEAAEARRIGTSDADERRAGEQRTDEPATERSASLLLEFRVLEATEAALASLPPAVAGGTSLARLIALAAASNACFAETGGNLAATFLGALVLNESLALGYRALAKAQAEEEKARRQRERRAERATAA